MKLVRLKIRNFRCYKSDFTLDIDDLTVLVGKNDSGKSSIFEALALFFDEYKPDQDDGTIDGDKTDVRVICEFQDIPEEIVIDANYPTTLKQEHLLNEAGNLEIHKGYNCSLKTPKPLNVYARAIHPTVEGCNDLLLLKNSELKQRADELGLDTTSIDVRVNTELRKLIRSHFENLQCEETEIPLDVEDAKKIWDKVKTELPTFALFKSDRQSSDQDQEAQDPMKAAVKEAINECKEDLDRITQFVENEVKKIAERTVSKIKEMDEDLAQELKPRFSPPNWSSVFKISLTGDEEIPINKRGSGIRRLILLNFFRAKAEQKALKEKSPNVIYAIEEPETCQHPNNQRMLMRAFYDLSQQDNCQVMLSTHTPMLARLAPENNLRYISIEPNNHRRVYSGKESKTLIAEALGVLPDHNVKIFIGVEGSNDINFLINMAKLFIRSGISVPDLESMELNGELIFFPLGGSNLALWVSRLKELNRPELFLFDRDTVPPEQPKYQDVADRINARENCYAFITSKKEMENYLHPDAIKSVRPEVDIDIDDFDDVPEKVAKVIHGASESEKTWDELSEKVQKKKISNSKSWLNTLVIEQMTLDMLQERDSSSEIKSWLDKINSLI